MSCMLVDSFRAEPGYNFFSILVLLESLSKTCMIYTTDECTVDEILMMADELSETCRIFITK